MNGRQTWAAAKEALWVCRHWAGILIGLVGVYLTNQHVQPWVLDDAYITYRYAENFAAGKGRHLEGENYAFVDGHVKWLARKSVPYTSTNVDVRFTVH